MSVHARQCQERLPVTVETRAAPDSSGQQVSVCLFSYEHHLLSKRRHDLKSAELYLYNTVNKAQLILRAFTSAEDTKDGAGHAPRVTTITTKQ